MQGETLSAIIADFRDGYIIPGSFYVAITRIKEGRNLFLRDFHPGYIRVSSDVNNKIAEMRQMKPYNFLKTYIADSCFKLDRKDLKVGYLNVNSLKDANHYGYINADKNLLHLDILCLSDTRLSCLDENENLHKMLSNWNILSRSDSSDGKIHMGLLVLRPRIMGQLSVGFISVDDVKNASGETTVQIIHAVYNRDIISFIYCNKTPNNGEVNKIIMETSKSGSILGDFNLNPENQQEKEKLDAICGKTKMIHFRGITTVRQNQLDHVIIEKCKKYQIWSDAFFNYVSDHKCIVMRQSHYANDEIEMRTKVDIKKEKNYPVESPDARPKYYRLTHEFWLDDEIINKYSELINKKFNDVYIFPTYFCLQFITQRKSYEDVKKFDKSGGLFSLRIVMIPLLQQSHWFLCVMEYEKNRLYILDPYTKEKDANDIVREHQLTLNKIETGFLKLHMKNKFRKSLRSLNKDVLLPPSIPEQDDGFNCGCFLLQFERCLAMGVPFAFSNANMPALRRQMRKELLDQVLCINLDQTPKRFDRRITNVDGESCWLNVILQMFLCALDYSPHHALWSGLGKKLESAQIKSSIDSYEIKELLQHEMTANDSTLESIMTGYQDARDALIILTENSSSWPDVYTLIYHTLQSSVSCHNCGRQSEGGAITQQLYTEIICPADNTNIKSTLETLYNQGEDIEYRCEGCGVTGLMSRKEQIVTEASSDYLAVLVKRTRSSYSHKLRATDDVILIDSSGCPRVYTPISIIHHRGGIEPRPGSIKHYLCDVKSRDYHKWYETSDASNPKELHENDVTKFGYIFLYRRNISN